MIRTDFVSNSSSSSFVLKNFTPETIGELDERFVNIINRCPHEIYFYKVDELNYSDDLLNELKESGFPFKINKDYKYEITLNLEKRKTIKKEILPLIKKILNETEKCCISFGCDDCGEYTGIATQMATTIELLYGFTADYGEGFEYTTVKKLLEGK